MTQPIALVLDHLELLENQECLDVMAELAAQLPGPAGAWMTLAGHGDPGNPYRLPTSIPTPSTRSWRSNIVCR
jgi:hypothetical protein